MTKSEDLEVCTKCGWYAHGPYRASACHPDRGAAADALAAQINLPSTKLGYGDGRLTFDLHEDLNITLEVDDRGFGIENVWILGCYAPEDVKELIEAIRNTKIGREPCRRTQPRFNKD